MNDPAAGPARETVPEKEARLVDQAISMQAALRDSYGAAGTGLVVLVLVLSVIGVAFAFAGGDEPVELFGRTARRTTWLGSLAVLTFSLTLVDLVLDPRGESRRRGEAVRALAALKNEYRAAAAAGADPEIHARLSETYCDLTGRLPQIPNVLFSR